MKLEKDYIARASNLCLKLTSISIEQRQKIIIKVEVKAKLL